MRTRILFLILGMLWSGVAVAQPVTNIGGVTPGHIPIYNSTTVIKDSGFSPTTLPTPVGVNIAGLQAIGSPTNGATQYVNGYYVAGDGGEGEFTFNSSSSATVDNGVVIAPNSGGGRWIRNTNSTTPNLVWWGAKPDWNGSTGTDNSTPIQAAVNWSNSVNGRIVTAKGLFAHTIQIVFGQSNAGINCNSGGYAFNEGVGASGQVSGGFVWTGTSGPSSMFLVEPSGAVSSPSTAIPVQGVSINGCGFFGRGIAQRGIFVISGQNGNYQNNYLEHFTNYAISMIPAAVVNGGQALAQHQDPQFNTFNGTTINQISAGDGGGILLGGYSNGVLAANASYNNFYSTQIRFQGSNTGLLMLGTDNNKFYNLTSVGSGSGWSVDVSVDTDGSVQLPSSSEYFYGVTWNSGNGMIVRGTTSFTFAVTGVLVTGLDKGNSSADPVLESGAGACWMDSTGIQAGVCAWNAAKIGLAYGGTNADLSVTGGTHNFLKQASTGAAITSVQPSCSDLSGVGTGCSAAAGITALTGDGTATGPGSVALLLATVNTNTGVWGSATQSGQFTVNGKGLVTAAANVTITPAISSVTGLGTNVALALASALNGSGGLVGFNGALGTPTSGVATNLTGTAAGLTSGTVTTNANLTGPIASSGNTTSITSQTGTGTTFAMSASPTFTGTAAFVNATHSGTLGVTGTTTIGTGGTGSTPATLTLNGGNGSTGGSIINLGENGGIDFYFGVRKAIFGSGNADFLIFNASNNVGMGLSVANGTAFFTSTVASTSTITGTTFAGGIGVAGAGYFGGLISGTVHASSGTVPTGTTGSCVASSFTGGSTAGKFSAAVCVAGTIILSGLPTAPNGYSCDAFDQTTPANTVRQTANTITSVTFTSTTTAADVVVFKCLAW